MVAMGQYNPADFMFPGFPGMGGGGGGIMAAPSIAGAPSILGTGPSVLAPPVAAQIAAATGAKLPGVPGVGGNKPTGGFGMPEAQMAMSGLQTLGNLWGAFKAASLAKKQFNFTRDTTETNMANQIRSYNTALEDRIRSRAVVEGMSPEDSQAYIDRNKAVRTSA